MEDREILALLFARSEQAIAALSAKFGHRLQRLAANILPTAQDAEEAVSDTYLAVWNTVPPHRPDPLKPYVGTISRQLSLNRYEAQHAQKRYGQVALALDELSECIPDTNDTDIGESVALSDALSRFLWTLPERTRIMFVRRYFYVSPIAEIAADFSMKESAVTMLMLRTRQKLAHFLKKEGFTL